jgi:hypothetical protein
MRILLNFRYFQHRPRIPLLKSFQAENEQRVRVAELQNDEKFHKAQQDAETRIKAMQVCIIPSTRTMAQSSFVG